MPFRRPAFVVRPARLRPLLGALLCLFASRAVLAQDTAQAAPRDTAAKPRNSGRILWILPNFSSVEDDTDQPIGRFGGFGIARRDSFDPYVIPYVGLVVTADAMSGNVPWGSTTSGYAKLYLATFADNTIGNFTVQGVFPALLDQDPRYFVRGKGNGLVRLGYAFSRTLVTRGRDGSTQVNASEILGTGLAAGIGSLYYPASARTTSAILSRWGQQIVLDGLAFTLKEFWPDLRRVLER